MKNRSEIILVFMLIACSSLLASCIGEKKVKQDIHYAAEDSIPYRIAILPPHYIPTEGNATTAKSIIMDDDRLFVADIARGALRNQLAGKGYQPVQLKIVDKILAGVGRDEGWKNKTDQELCKLLEVDGVVHINIYSADMIKAVAFDLFKLDAEVKMINAQGENIGSWRETASKRRVSVPTGILSLAGTLVEQVFADPTSRQMRMVIYEWAWNLSQSFPDCPTGDKLPEVISVDSNVDNKIFGVGHKIAVRVDGEKELSCSFSIGDFKKNIPLPQTSPGVYEGFYAVKEGDKAANEPLMIRMRKSNGVERLWIESGSLLTLDGILPKSPREVKSHAGREGIELSWKNPDGETLEEFIVERGDDPVGKFEVVGRTHELKFTDPQSPQGRTVYYRVRSVDLAGNLSPAESPVAVTVPQFDELELSGLLSGKLVRGNYVILSPVRVDPGQKLEIGSGTVVSFRDGGRLDVSGQLSISGNLESPVIMTSSGTQGIFSETGGQIKIQNAVFRNFDRSVIGNGGYIEINSTEFVSNATAAIDLRGDGAFELGGIRITGPLSGVIIHGGNGELVRSYISNCTAGVEYYGGKLTLEENNIYANRMNIKAGAKLVVENNYFGSSSPDSLRTEGDVLVRSILDAPYPHGRKIVLVDEAVMTPELKEKRFSEAKEKGEKAFHEQHYGDSYKAFQDALKYGEDRDVYLYLTYTLLALGEDQKLEQTLADGIAKFPYDVRLHQIYVRHLMGLGKIGQARAVLAKALKLSPADPKLIYMKDYIDSASIKNSALEKKSETDKNGSTEVKNSKSIKENPAKIKTENVKVVKDDGGKAEVLKTEVGKSGVENTAVEKEKDAGRGPGVDQKDNKINNESPKVQDNGASDDS